MTRLTEARGAELFEASKNWGRWGADDERGALNLLTPERVARATALVRSGTVVSCGRELPVAPAADNPTPALHYMVMAGDLARGPGLQVSADFVGVSFHGMAVSHIDALCHVFVDGQMYNGYPASDVTSLGAKRNSIAAAFGGIVGRGVFLDIPRLRGVEWLEPGDAVTPDELDSACRARSVAVEPGDIVLVGTGRDARRAAFGPWNPNDPGLAGLDPECIPWLHERDLSVLGSDGVSDVLPANPHAWPIPVHQCLLVGMGVHLLDNLRLDRLATACAAAARWEFLFVVLPLQIGGGTGSPVNPVAML
ncbi:MAG: cyclase family protein [Actinomycetota bacterium]|nr:cyclase family protein [Actinomycetota bacterium]